jgi:hypothetical protein
VRVGIRSISRYYVYLGKLSIAFAYGVSQNMEMLSQQGQTGTIEVWQRRQHRAAIAKRSCIALFASTLLCAGIADSADSWVKRYPETRQQTNAACQQKRLQECLDGLNEILKLVDGRPDIRCLQATVQAQLGKQQAALESLSVCARSQLDFPALLSSPTLQSLRSSTGYSEIERIYHLAMQPAVEYEVHQSLSDPELLTEDMIYDPADGSFLVSSVRERKIVRVVRDGKVADVITSTQIPMWGVFALALDPHRHVLWVTTTAVPQSPPFDKTEDGRSAVLRIDLRAHTLLGRYELSDDRPHAFGDMTLARDGGVFVADGLGGGVYLVHPDRREAFEVIVSPGFMRSPQTPALSSDGSTLLVPDYSRGIVKVNLKSGEPVWLSHQPELALFGIDGFYWQGHTLIAIQNGTKPERVLVMTLDKGCSTISAWRVAVARASGLGEPTHGVVRGKYFYFLANSGWDRVDDTGQAANAIAAIPSAIWRMNLAKGDLTGIDCRPHSNPT